MSSNHGSQRVEPYRIINDVNAAYIELLSAVCAVERVRMRHSFEDIVKHCEPDLVARTTQSANAICKYFSQLEKHLAK